MLAFGLLAFGVAVVIGVVLGIWIGFHEAAYLPLTF